MSTMKALVLREWGGPLELEELPIPEPGPGEVRVKVSACGVGDTLNNMRSGRNASIPGASVPRIIGHEVAGTVVEGGPGTADFPPGQRVVVYMYLTCGRCAACRWGHDPLCERLRGLVGLAIDGGFAEHLVVPTANVLPVPDEVSDLDACVAVDAVATPWHALRGVARLDPTQTLAVIGAGGGVGVHAVMVGRLLGAHVIGIDITEAKLDFALSHGAHAVVDGRADDVPRRVMELTSGRGAHAVLDYVADAATLSAGFSSLAPGGKLVIQGVNPPGTRLDIEPRSFIHREVAVSGSRYASRREVSETLALVARGSLKPAVSATVALEQAEELFGRLARRELLGRAAIVMNDDAGDRFDAFHPSSRRTHVY